MRPLAHAVARMMMANFAAARTHARTARHARVCATKRAALAAAAMRSAVRGGNRGSGARPSSPRPCGARVSLRSRVMASASAAATPAGGCCAGAGVARAATTTGAPALLDAGALTTAVGAEALARVGSGEVLLCARAAGTALELAGGDGEGIAAVLGGVGACASAALRDSSVADFLAALVGPTLQLRVVDGEVQLGGAPGVWVFDFGGGRCVPASVQLDARARARAGRIPRTPNGGARLTHRCAGIARATQRCS